MIYPKHIYDPIRRQVAISYVQHELRKLFPSLNDDLTKMGYKANRLMLSCPICTLFAFCSCLLSIQTDPGIQTRADPGRSTPQCQYIHKQSPLIGPQWRNNGDFLRSKLFYPDIWHTIGTAWSYRCHGPHIDSIGQWQANNLDVAPFWCMFRQSVRFGTILGKVYVLELFPFWAPWLTRQAQPWSYPPSKHPTSLQPF